MPAPTIYIMLTQIYYIYATRIKYIKQYIKSKYHYLPINNII